MKKVLIAILASLTIIMVSIVGFSAFTYMGEDVIFEYGDGEPSDLPYVTFDYCDANMTDDYKYYFDSSITITESKVPLPNVDNSTHQFQGWYMDRQGTTKLNFSNHTFVAGERFYAKYKNTSISSLTGTSAMNIYDGSPSSNPMFFSKYNTMGTMNITNKIDIRYSSSGTYNSDSYGDSGATVYRLPNDAKMRIILDCDITISSGGTLQLSSVLGVNSGSNYNGIISNVNYTALDLNGYTITVKNGGSLNAYGIIYNSRKTGGIIVESGGSMTTVFCMADFKGGTNLVGSYQKALMSFASYSCPYWFCETVFYTGATLYGETSLCASNSKYNTTATLIGSSSSALVQLTSGFIVRKGMDFDYFINRTVDYGNITNINALLTSAYRTKLIFTKNLDNELEQLSLTASSSTCDVSVNSLSMTVSAGMTVDVSMAYGDFPVSPHLDIEAHSASVSISMSIVVMPSGTVKFDENSSLTFTTVSPNSYTIYARLTTLDEIPKDYYFSNKSNARAAGSYYLNARLINSTIPGFVDMQGTFSFNTSGISTTSNDFNKYSIGGNIKLSQQALNSLVANQDYVCLQSRFFYSYLYAYSGGTLTKKMLAMPARYYFSPIISDDKVYFQPSGNTIVEGEVFDTYNGLFKYNGDIYFMYYSNRSNTTTAWSLSLTNRNPPSSSEQTNKYNNTVGNFVVATSVGYAVDNAYGKHGLYITYSGDTYCYVNGAFIKATPTTGGNTVSNITGITNGEKFHVSDTQSSGVNSEPHCLTTLTYDYKTERWLWTK